MRRNASNRQAMGTADDALHALVRLLARAAAREAVTTTPQPDAELHARHPHEGEKRAE